MARSRTRASRRPRLVEDVVEEDFRLGRAGQLEANVVGAARNQQTEVEERAALVCPRAGSKLGAEVTGVDGTP